MKHQRSYLLSSEEVAQVPVRGRCFLKMEVVVLPILADDSDGASPAKVVVSVASLLAR